MRATCPVYHIYFRFITLIRHGDAFSEPSLPFSFLQILHMHKAHYRPVLCNLDSKILLKQQSKYTGSSTPGAASALGKRAGRDQLTEAADNPARGRHTMNSLYLLDSTNCEPHYYAVLSICLSLRPPEVDILSPNTLLSL